MYICTYIYTYFIYVYTKIYQMTGSPPRSGSVTKKFHMTIFTRNIIPRVVSAVMRRHGTRQAALWLAGAAGSYLACRARDPGCFVRAGCSLFFLSFLRPFPGHRSLAETWLKLAKYSWSLLYSIVMSLLSQREKSWAHHFCLFLTLIFCHFNLLEMYICSSDFAMSLTYEP